MGNALQRLRKLAEPSITIDEAIAGCKKLVSKHPELNKVISRIKQLREERDLLHEVASEAMSDVGWEKSDLKKWADKQSRDPDND